MKLPRERHGKLVASYSKRLEALRTLCEQGSLIALIATEGAPTKY